MPRSPWPPPARPLTVAPSIGETFMAPACHPEWQRRIRRRAAAARPFPGRQEPGRTRMLFRSCGILPLRSSGLRLTGAQDDRARRQVHAYGGSLLPCSLPIDPPSRSLTIVPPACSLPIFPPSPSPWLPPARLAHHSSSFPSLSLFSILPARSPLSLLPCSLTIVPPARSLTIGPPSPSPWLPPAPITVAPSFPHHRRGAASGSEQARYRSAKNSGDGWGDAEAGLLAAARSAPTVSFHSFSPYSLLPFLLILITGPDCQRSSSHSHAQEELAILNIKIPF